MADNITLNAGSSGSTLACASLTFSGDTSVVQIVGCGILSGSEGSWTFSQFVGGAGAVAAGVQRVTMASDDPGVALLGTIDADTGAIKTAVELLDNAISGAGFNITQFAGAAVPIGAGVEATAVRVTLATDSTGTLTVDTTGTSGLEVVQATAADLNVTEASASAIKTAVEKIDDWDESDRAKVNVIAGQAGIAGGTGGDGATVPRVTLATDIGLPAGTAALGKVKADSAVDSNNSTTTPLGGSATYTGTGTDLTGYSAVCVTIYADVDSGTDGMTFQFSSDNSNWDDTYAFTLDFSASSTRRFQFPICARYFRIVYVNGGGAQSAFRVQTILHTANQLTSIHRISNDMSPDRSAQVVKAALFAQKAGSGDLTLVDATAGGNLKVAVEEFDGALAAGTNTIGGVISQPSITTCYDGTTAVTMARKSGVAATGTVELVAATADKKVRIFALSLIATSATETVVYLATTTDTDVLGNSGNGIALAKDADGDNVGGFVLPWNPGGWTETSTANEALNLVLSTANDVIWCLTYALVD